MTTLKSANQAYTGLVQKYVGSAYDNILLVLENIDAIIRLSNLTPNDWDQITVLAGLTAELQTLSPIASDITAVANIATELLIVSSDPLKTDISIVAAPANITAINAVAGNMTAILSVNQAVLDAEAARDAAQSSANAANNSDISAQFAQSQAETAAANAVQSASAADTSRINSETAATNAMTSADASQVSSVSASNAATYAHEWATKGENTPVSIAAGGDGSTDFSSLHYSKKSEATLVDFETKYMGAYASAPVASMIGSIYFDTTSNIMYVWTGSAWNTVASTTGIVFEGTFLAVTGSPATEYPTLPGGRSSFWILTNDPDFTFTQNSPIGTGLNGQTVALNSYLTWSDVNQTWGVSKNISDISGFITANGNVPMTAPLRFQTGVGTSEMSLDYQKLLFAAGLTFNISAITATGNTGVRFQEDGSVSINTATPVTQFQLENHTYFGKTGGGIPVEGAGVRIMWYPDLAAFRVGSVTGSSWDAANIGVNSVCFGKNTEASSESSIAFGELATASGAFAAAIGYSSQSPAPSSVALGTGANSTGIESTAIGLYASASGNGSVAIGSVSSATAYKQIVIGSRNILGSYSPTSWVITEPLLTVGNGNPNGLEPPSTAVTVLKNGNMGIGSTNESIAPISKFVVDSLPVGTLAAPPIKIAAGSFWLDTTDSTTHPILRVMQ